MIKINKLNLILSTVIVASFAHTSTFAERKYGRFNLPDSKAALAIDSCEIGAVKQSIIVNKMVGSPKASVVYKAKIGACELQQIAGSKNFTLSLDDSENRDESNKIVINQEAFVSVNPELGTWPFKYISGKNETNTFYYVRTNKANCITELGFIKYEPKGLGFSRDGDSLKRRTVTTLCKI